MLNRVYFFWQEYFTPAGKALAAMFFFSFVCGAIPGFYAAWIFCGIIFLLFLGVVLSLFVTSKLNNVTIKSATVANIYEGDFAIICANVVAKNNVNYAQLGAYRLPKFLKTKESDFVKITQENTTIKSLLYAKCRGAFNLKRIAINVQEIMGTMRIQYPLENSVEFLVYPKKLNLVNFDFLTNGQSGMAFSALLTPGLSRGMEFAGVREYREGDSLRDLHHKAFARYGKPFTKEFEEERGCGIILLLDIRCNKNFCKNELEFEIVIAASVGNWLIAHNVLGRLFICDNEIQLGETAQEIRESMLEAFARIPHTKIIKNKNAPWSPKARPMGPVLRIGLYSINSELWQKQIIISNHTKNNSNDSLLFINAKDICTEFSL